MSRDNYSAGDRPYKTKKGDDHKQFVEITSPNGQCGATIANLRLLSNYRKKIKGIINTAAKKLPLPLRSRGYRGRGAILNKNKIVTSSISKVGDVPGGGGAE